ncbi:ethionine resistance protein [Scheffersomyces xylosifermentans]|uniref:ethionine resistance protein n=1 Tax=Scheffersomyces xylosifermentans TaxID=1304137 RepID=UPI00315C8DE8
MSNNLGTGETAPLLTVVSTHSSVLSEEESDIISYIDQRRVSIASAGPDRIPSPFTIKHASIHERDRLSHSISHNSLHVPDISDLISNHDIAPEPETNFETEVKVLLYYSAPLILTFLLQYSLTVASVFSVGRLGPSELAAVSLSSMTANISGYAIIQGVSTCLDTLCAQAYGRKDFNTVGLHFIRCNYLLLLLFLPMFCFWVFGAEPTLLAIIGDDEAQLCHLAATYLRILSFGLPGFILFENAKHFLQSQGVFHASTYVLIICAPLNAFLNYLLVWDKNIGIGFSGAPLSVVITNWLMCFSLYGYIFFVKGYQCWPKQQLLDAVYFRNWSKMIDLSIPGVLMVEAEWLAFEIITFTASTFGTKVLAAQSIVSTTCVLLYQIPFAISIAASTRVAWYIGAASIKSAQIATSAAINTSLSLGIINCSFIYIFREFLASLYTNEEDVIKLASKVLIIGAIYQINDFLSCSTGGILRGQGRQKIGGILNLISYYLIALPCAFLCAFYFKLQLVGLWLGMIIALFFVSVSQYYFVATSDWEAIISECINEGILEEGNIHIDAHSSVPAMTSSTYV